MLDQMTQAREQADGAARSLAGEGPSSGMAMPGSAPVGNDLGAAPPAGGASAELDQLAAGTDNFGATDAAAGGASAMGRETR